MRNLICLLLSSLIFVSNITPELSEQLPEIRALSAVVMAETGEILYEREPDRMLPMASTTKLMTALVVIESCPLDAMVDILPEYCGVEGSSLYLKPGERYTVRELLQGLLLASGNDAAVALACFCAGSIDAFSERMNQCAAELGMRNSHFLNPHGLNEAGHCSTARDLGILMLAAMKNDSFSELISREKAIVGGQTVLNHNKLLQRYPGCIGGKTGYTKVAGRCLVSCCKKDDLRLVCVTLNDPDDWNDHAMLYDWAYEHFSMFVINRENTRYEIPLLGGMADKAIVVPLEEHRILLPRTSEPIVETKLPFYAFSPVSEGFEAGFLRVLLNNRLICEIPLIFIDDYPIR